MALTDRQQELLRQWLPGVEVVRDHSWGLVGTTVLELRHDGSHYIAKAGDERDRHLAREARAHREWLEPWTSIGRAPRLIHADDDAKMVLTRYLPGSLVEGSDHEMRADTYHPAGELLALLHGQRAVEDTVFEARAKAKALVRLDMPHRMRDTARLRALIESWPAPPCVLVPAHGGWQPRNWLVHEDVVSVIDFGRVDLRPAFTDFGRLAVQQFRKDPTLEPAFLTGYGSDPRDPDAWRRHQIREAIGTATWAYQVGDEAFEQQGHRMLADALDG